MILTKFVFVEEATKVMEDLEMGVVYQPVAGSDYVRRAFFTPNPNGKYFMFYNETEEYDPGENNALPYTLPFIVT